MSKLIRKFENHLPSLTSAVAGETDLRDNYKLYNKIHRFYSKEGIQFTGDTATDYTIIINYLSEDLA